MQMDSNGCTALDIARGLNNISCIKMLHHITNRDFIDGKLTANMPSVTSYTTSSSTSFRDLSSLHKNNLSSSALSAENDILNAGQSIDFESRVLILQIKEQLAQSKAKLIAVQEQEYALNKKLQVLL